MFEESNPNMELGRSPEPQGTLPCTLDSFTKWPYTARPEEHAINHLATPAVETNA